MDGSEQNSDRIVKKVKLSSYSEGEVREEEKSSLQILLLVLESSTQIPE